MENTKYRKRRTPIRAKAQDTRANPNSWETHLVRKRWNIGLLRALSLWIMMIIAKIMGLLQASRVQRKVRYFIQYSHRDIELDYKSDIYEFGPKNRRETFLKILVNSRKLAY